MNRPARPRPAQNKRPGLPCRASSRSLSARGGIVAGTPPQLLSCAGRSKSPDHPSSVACASSPLHRRMDR